ncbi:hypothetical protein [Psychrobacter sp. UBA3480]|uniref:hypothetical protein n=1 Tax=Psychrobacter sp. UBA3480 TaxID=1947350 RepID=UPI0025D6704F|nr:hypothetical protein [Psychrobacter sp. UBA3480]
MHLQSNGEKPLTPKALAKVNCLLLNASLALTNALKATQDIYTDNADKWTSHSSIRNENPIVEVSVRYYGEWVEESESNEESADGRTINDCDHLVLKHADAVSIIALINEALKPYKKVQVSCSISEKCYLRFSLSVKKPV